MTRTGTSVLADLQSVNRMKSLGVRDQRNRPKTLYPSSSTKDGFDRETRHMMRVCGLGSITNFI